MWMKFTFKSFPHWKFNATFQHPTKKQMNTQKYYEWCIISLQLSVSFRWSDLQLFILHLHYSSQSLLITTEHVFPYFHWYFRSFIKLKSLFAVVIIFSSLHRSESNKDSVWTTPKHGYSFKSKSIITLNLNISVVGKTLPDTLVMVSQSHLPHLPRSTCNLQDGLLAASCRCFSWSIYILHVGLWMWLLLT